MDTMSYDDIFPVPDLPDSDTLDDLVKDLGGLAISHRNPTDRALAALGVGCGWKQSSERGNDLIARDGSGEKINFTSGSADINRFRTLAKKILRHACPAESIAPPGVLINEIISRVKISKDHQRLLQQALESTSKKPLVAGPGGTVDVPKMPKKQAAQKAPERTAPSQPDVSQAPVAPVADHVVKRVPYESHNRPRKGGSEIYDSPGIMERTWHSGKVDYDCSYDCGYEHDKMESVRSHVAKVHRSGQGRAGQPVVVGIDPKWVVGRNAAISRIRQDLEAAFSAGIGADAAALAEWMVDNRPQPETTVEIERPDTPQTPDEILRQIAALVDNGHTAMLEAQVARQDEALDALGKERDDALARADESKKNLDTLKSIVNDLD